MFIMLALYNMTKLATVSYNGRKEERREGRWLKMGRGEGRGDGGRRGGRREGRHRPIQ